jgi:hypothetical protein
VTVDAGAKRRAITMSVGIALGTMTSIGVRPQLGWPLAIAAGALAATLITLALGKLLSMRSK